MNEQSELKLNLGCGANKMAGYINVDKFASLNPDLVFDLEKTPYPFPDNSVREIVLHHVLEHIGQIPDVFIGVMKEIYRICAPGALVKITVPHWRHDNFYSDPTHVRVITPMTLRLFDRSENENWAKLGASNSPLAIVHGVDFQIAKTEILLDEPFLSKLADGSLSEENARDAIHYGNNVVNQMTFELIVRKDAARKGAASVTTVPEKTDS